MSTPQDDDNFPDGPPGGWGPPPAGISPRLSVVSELVGYMNPDGPSTEPAEPALPSGLIWMSDDWDTLEPPIVPTIVPVIGGLPLLYPGESHLLAGGSGAGKSWFAQFAAATTVRNDERARVLFLDFESNRRTLKLRLQSLGVTKAEAGRIAYLKTSANLHLASETGALVHGWVGEHKPSLVILDSISKSMSACNLDENSNTDFNQWDIGVVEPFTDRRITSLLIDHVPKEQQGFSRGTKFARGASAKKDRVSGAYYLFEVKDGEGWSTTKDGRATITCQKDREGARRTGEVAADMVVTVSEPGSMHVALHAPAGDTDGSKGTKLPLRVMQAASEYLEVLGEARTQSKLIEACKPSKEKTTVEALNILVGEGYVSLSDGPRGSKLYKSLRPYRRSEDPRSSGGVSFGGPADDE